MYIYVYIYIYIHITAIPGGRFLGPSNPQPGVTPWAPGVLREGSGGSKIMENVTFWALSVFWDCF